MTVARILFLADTHLGFDLPLRPRIERRRRGHDFFDNYERVLDAALAERVDAIVHGGDLLYRSRVPARLVQQAFAPLKRMAEVGVPVYLVPGNHERSHIPHAMLALHPRIHVFDRPQTFALEAKGLRLALAGFPCERKEARKRFAALVEDTGWRDAGAAVNLLCVHQAFEGATVGPSDFTFRSGDDVVRAADVPVPFAAVLAGHVHRHQVLTSDLGGRPLPTRLSNAHPSRRRTNPRAASCWRWESATHRVGCCEAGSSAVSLRAPCWCVSWTPMEPIALACWPW